MGSTPEGLTKKVLRDLLARYPGMYSYWPVPSGFGKSTVDCVGCYRGRFFACETKAVGKKPTLRQQEELNAMQRAMAHTFVMSGPKDPEFDRLAAWLDYLTEWVGYDPHLTPDQVNRRAI